MCKAFYIGTLAGLALMSSVQAAAADSMGGTVSLTQTVANANASGFRSFAIAYDPADTMINLEDSVASPALTWFMRGALSVSHEDPAAAEVIRDLRADHFVLHGEIRIDQFSERYSQRTAVLEQRDFGVATRLRKPSNDIAFALKANLSADFSYAQKNQFTGDQSVQGFADGTLSGVRVVAGNGDATLYIFSDTDDRLDVMRREMSVDSWAQLVAKFARPDDYELLDLSFDHRSGAVEPILPSAGFGMNFTYHFTYPHDFIENFETVFANGRLHYAASSDAEAFKTPAGWVDPCVLPASIADIPGVYVPCHPGEFIPFATPHLSALKPLIYAVVDNRSGMIVVLGEHH